MKILNFSILPIKVWSLDEKFVHSIGYDRKGEQIPTNQQFSFESGSDCFLKVIGSHVKTNLRYKMINYKGFAIRGWCKSANNFTRCMDGLKMLP